VWVGGWGGAAGGSTGGEQGNSLQGDPAQQQPPDSGVGESRHRDLPPSAPAATGTAPGRLA